MNHDHFKDPKVKKQTSQHVSFHGTKLILLKLMKLAQEMFLYFWFKHRSREVGKSL